MNSFKKIAKKEFLNSKKEIFPFIFENNQYWLKRARQTKPDKLQNFFYKFLPFELLIPPLVKNSYEALKFETKKLEDFRNFGIDVPKVVLIEDEFFVLEDSGKSVYSIFREENISEKEFYTFMDELIEILAKIHNFGLFHGGSQLRNFTYKENKVYAIDFEESFASNIDIKTLQHRDFLLFILSFTKLKELGFKIDYAYIIEHYMKATNNYFVLEKLKKLAKRLRFFIFLSKKSFVNKKLGSDVKYFFELFDIINSLEIKDAK